MKEDGYRGETGSVGGQQDRTGRRGRCSDLGILWVRDKMELEVIVYPQ